MNFSHKRYQLKKEAERVVKSGHPWIFRSHLSSAANVFKTGDWLCLYSTTNQPLGYGTYDEEGLVAIRILKRGATPPDAKYFAQKFNDALDRRAQLRKFTNAYRALHGENDEIPGVVLDVYNKVGVLQTYSRSIDSIGRYAASWFAKRLGLEATLWKTPKKSGPSNKNQVSRWLRGVPIDAVEIKEGSLVYFAPLLEGQKSGSFLDLRGLRKWLVAQKLSHARVLNLFSYTGSLGLAAELAGAREIWNVDISKGALQFSKKYNTKNPKKYQWISANIFDWVRELNPREEFDLIIVDPAQMTSKVSQVAIALKTYERLYRTLIPRVKKGGYLVACCCTSRISNTAFKALTQRVAAGKLKTVRAITPEDDHPVGFEEGNYLKMFIFRR